MKRRMAALFLVLLMVVSASFGLAQAQVISPVTSDNLYSHDYWLYRTYNRPWNWSDTVLSYLIAHDDGSYTRVEASDDYNVAETDRYVTIEDYSSTFSITSQQKLPFELPLFGGFYEGSDYYFLVFGQENPTQSDAAEVVRVVRYTKSWQRIDSVSAYGANTTIPFDAGSLRMLEVGGMLYIHTSHEMYKSSDGLNHQANLTFAIRISDMTLTDSKYSVSNVGTGYVSHSFNQFIDTNGTDLVTVDHGDAHLRSVILCRYSGTAGSETMAVNYNRNISYIEVLPIQGAYGSNETGAQVGALQVSNTHYLVAGTSVAQDDTYNPYGMQNVFLTATPIDDFTEATTTLTYFTDEPLDSSTMISNPYLVEITGSKYLLMWNADDVLYYLFVDNAGKQISEVKTMNAQLSDCQPVVAGEQVVWYVTNNSVPMFFAIDLSGKAHTHSYTAVVTAPGCYDQGYTTHVCTCGDRYVDSYEAATGHNWEEYYEAIAPGCDTNGQMRAYCQNPNCSYYRYYYTGALGHDYVSGVCSRCGEADPDYVGLFDLAGANMALGNSLTMNLYVNASDVAGGDYYMEIVKTYADGRADAVKTVPMSQWSPYGGMYYVSFDGVAAKEMTDDFYVTVYHADGIQASNTKTISIADYAISMLNRTDSTSAASHNLMADMLNYGAAAQQSFKYAQNDLANANMTPAHKACGTQNFSMDQFSNNTVKGTGFVGANLSLESSICMYLYFDQNVVDRTMTARVSYVNHNKKAVSYEIPGSEFTVLGGYGFYGVEITTMAAADAESMVTVEILDGGKVVASGSTSVESVAFNGYAGVPLYVDLMKFCAAAYNFFH